MNWSDFIKIADPFEMFLAKLFGERTVNRAGDFAIAVYKWRGRFYVTECSSTGTNEEKK